MRKLKIRENLFKRLKRYKRKVLDISFYSISGGALFFQTLVLYDIATKGRFTAIESNPYVLGTEVAFTALGDCLFVYKYIKFLKQR